MGCGKLCLEQVASQVHTTLLEVTCSNYISVCWTLLNWRAMSCYAMPCHAMPCHAMPCHAMPCHAVLRHATLCCAVTCHAVLCHATLCCAVPCHAMPCHAVPASSVTANSDSCLDKSAALWLSGVQWVGYIKDYDGGTLMECVIVQRLPHTRLPAMLQAQKRALDSRIRQYSKSHIAHPGLSAFQEGCRRVDISSIPGQCSLAIVLQLMPRTFSSRCLGTNLRHCNTLLSVSSV